MNRLGKSLTEEEALEVLGSVMRFLYLINQNDQNQIDQPPVGTEVTA